MSQDLEEKVKLLSQPRGRCAPAPLSLKLQSLTPGFTHPSWLLRKRLLGPLVCVKPQMISHKSEALSPGSKPRIVPAWPDHPRPWGRVTLLWGRGSDVAAVSLARSRGANSEPRNWPTSQTRGQAHEDRKRVYSSRDTPSPSTEQGPDTYL